MGVLGADVGISAHLDCRGWLWYPLGMGLSDWQKQEYARKEVLVSKEEQAVDMVKEMMAQRNSDRNSDRDWLDELAEMLKLQPQSHRWSAVFAENELNEPPFIVTEVP